MLVLPQHRAAGGIQRTFEAIPARHQQRNRLQRRVRLVLDPAAQFERRAAARHLHIRHEYLIRRNELQRGCRRRRPPALLNAGLIVVRRRT